MDALWPEKTQREFNWRFRPSGTRAAAIPVIESIAPLLVRRWPAAR